MKRHLRLHQRRQAADIYFGNSSNDSPSITNTSTGLFEQTGGAATSTVTVLFNNLGGTVNVTTGTLNLSGGSTGSSGNFNAQTPATLGLAGTISGSYLGSGTGTVDLSGVIQVQAGGANCL